MIQLDTNFLIGAVNKGSPLEAILKRWLLEGESLATSSIAWAEFLNGPVSKQHVWEMSNLIEGRIVPFGGAEAEKASELFNETGRKRTARFDCFIAATAICSGASLATQNRKDFAPFVAAGLRLA